MKRLACLAGGLLLTTVAAPTFGQADSRRATHAPRRAPTAHAVQRPNAPEREYVSRGDARRLQEVIRRERQRYGHLLPQPGMSGPMLNAKQPLRATANNQWIPIGPLKAGYLKYGDITVNATDSGAVTDVATELSNPSVVYLAAQAGGLWKSLNGGASWSAKTEGLDNLSANAIALDPQDARVLYITQYETGGSTVIKSLDGADTWQGAALLPGANWTNELIVSPSESNIVLAATDNGLFRSTDAGAHFVSITLPGREQNTNIWSLAWAGGSDFTLSRQDNVHSSEIWRSTDQGATWSRTLGIPEDFNIGRISIASAPSMPSTQYAIASSTNPTSYGNLANIFKSTDGGATWVGIAMGGNDFKPFTNPNAESQHVGMLLHHGGEYWQVVAVDPSNPEVAYFGGMRLLAVTRDGGGSFTQLSNWKGQFGLPYVQQQPYDLHLTRGGRLYAGTEGGLALSTDAGVTWTQSINEGLNTHYVHNICSSALDRDAVVDLAPEKRTPCSVV